MNLWLDEITPQLSDLFASSNSIFMALSLMTQHVCKAFE